MDEPNVVLKFSEIRLQTSESHKQDQPSATNSPPGVALPQAHPPGATSQIDPNNANPHSRMNADILGEELDPQATIWKMYVEEATEQDDELAEVENKNLDLMLLFAALFSAILTAFLIESKNLLQQDPADTSVALLLFIAQSQRRLELGVPSSVLDPLETPPFVPTLVSRFINGLWFTSLALSISAALVAMLAKEWLAAYIAVSVRPAHDRALARQARFDGLIAWRALPIIAFLPTLLHLSLLLFSLGLVLYLLTLDLGIAIVIASITGFTALFYGGTTIYGALYESCPFVTQISKYARQALKVYIHDWTPRRTAFDSDVLVLHHAVDKQASQALAWLAKSSHDPAVVDCTYQAVASYVALRNEAFYEINTQNGLGASIPISSARVVSDTSANILLFYSICTRLSVAERRGSNNLLASQGLGIARCASVLPKLLLHIYAHIGLDRATQYIQMATRDTTDGTDHTLINLAISALRDIEAVFGDKGPSMSADAYALVSAANLGLLAALAITGYSPPSAPIRLYRENEPLNIESLPDFETSPDLAVCSGLALARTSVQLRYHLKGQARISLGYLTHLLKAVSEVAAHDYLRTDTRCNIRVIGASLEQCFPPNHDRISNNTLTESLVDMLRVPELLQQPRLFYITGQALASISPMYLTHKPTNLTVQYWESLRANPFLINSATSLTDMPNDPHLGTWIVGRLLAVSALPLSTYDRLPISALETLTHLVKRMPGWFSLWEIQQHSQLIEQWIDQVHKLDQDIPGFEDLYMKAGVSLTGLIGFMLARGFSRYQPNWLDLSWESTLVPLLQIVSRTPGQSENVNSILIYITSPNTLACRSMKSFLGSSKGFLTLLLIRQHKEYTSVVSQAVERILEWDSLVLGEDSIKGLLDVVIATLSDTSSISSIRSRGGFIEGMLKHLKDAQSRNVHFPWDHPALDDIQKRMEGDTDRAGVQRLERFKAIRNNDPGDQSTSNAIELNKDAL